MLLPASLLELGRAVLAVRRAEHIAGFSEGLEMQRFLGRALAALFIGLLLVSCAHAQSATSMLATANSDSSVPIYDHYELDFESGLIWKVGGGATPLSYRMLPQLITVKWPANAHWKVGSGHLVIRPRYSFVGESIIHGPEHYFFGVTASGSLEYWDASQRFCAFFCSGGGAGIMHAKGYVIKGAQGEDFDLTWLIYSGVRYRFSETMNVGASVYFQHISNGGLDKVNPGVNAIGPMLSLGWRF